MSPGKMAAIPGANGKRDMRKTDAFGIIPSFVVAAFALVQHNSGGT
jgi:hypothetical protein